MIWTSRQYIAYSNSIRTNSSVYSLQVITRNPAAMRREFEWSLKPILILTKFFGIKLNVTENVSLLSRFALNFAGLGHLISILVYGIITIQKHQTENNNMLVTNNEFSNYSKLDQAKYFLYVKSAQMLFLFDMVCCLIPYLIIIIQFSLSKNGISLWNTLIKIQEDFQLSEMFHRKVRTQCYIFIPLFFMVRSLEASFYTLSCLSDKVIGNDIPSSVFFYTYASKLYNCSHYRLYAQFFFLFFLSFFSFPVSYIGLSFLSGPSVE